ncbi:hypothetical protein EYR40_003056 [Pleurotus pulmonarius]|nr:hypothetical protein EYR36_005505 [Pleurotus pulmonarius]KAF4580658.1 hypothetical protein EYR40_003056 [Pleurotus pulmonarius]
MYPKISPSPYPKPEKRKDREDDQIEPKFPKRRRPVNDDGHRSPPPEAGPSRITIEMNTTTPDPMETRNTPKVAVDRKSTLRTMVEGKLSYSYKEKL